MKKVRVVKVASLDAAASLEGLPLEATVAVVDVAGAMRDGLLAFATSAGLVVKISAPRSMEHSWCTLRGVSAGAVQPCSA